jgi:hypothetical protein
MIVLNEVYEVLKARLTEIESVKKVDWYNEQYTNTENEKATRYPAVYVDFSDMNWQQSGDRFQHGACTIRLHCVVFDVKDTPVPTMEFVQQVFKHLNSKSLYNADNFQLTTELVRTFTSFPKRYNQLKVVHLDFSCEVFDVTDMPALVPVHPVSFVIT